MIFVVLVLVVINVVSLICIGVLWRQSKRDASRYARINGEAGYWKGYQDGISSERRGMY